MALREARIAISEGVRDRRAAGGLPRHRGHDRAARRPTTTLRGRTSSSCWRSRSALTACAIGWGLHWIYPRLQPDQRLDRRRARSRLDRARLGRGGRTAALAGPRRDVLSRPRGRRAVGDLGGRDPRSLLAQLLPPARRRHGRGRLRRDPPSPDHRGRDAADPDRAEPLGLAPHQHRDQDPAVALAPADGAADDQRDHRPRRRRDRGRRQPRRHRAGGDRRRDDDLARADRPALAVDPRPARRSPAGDRGGRRRGLRRRRPDHDGRRARRARRLLQPDGRAGCASASGSARPSAHTSTTRSPITSSATGSPSRARSSRSRSCSATSGTSPDSPRAPAPSRS